MRFSLRLFIAMAFAMPFNSIASQLNIADIYADSAIIQRNVPIKIWGTAPAGQMVDVLLGTNKASVVSDAQCKWQVVMPAMGADSKDYQLKVSCGEESICRKGLKVGEVWLASGQSNMEYYIYMGVTDMEKTLSERDFPDIRFFSAGGAPSAIEMDKVASPLWRSASRSNRKGMSAVAYFFARELYIRQGVPVGIISAARGATDITSWISRVMLDPIDYMSDYLKVSEPDNWIRRAQLAESGNKMRDSIVRHSFRGISQGILRNDYDDSLWKESSVPYGMGQMGYNGYWGIIWHRKSFDLALGFNRHNSTLVLPMAAMKVDIYLNGHHIHERDDSTPTTLQLKIPANTLKSKGNVLVIRMYTAWGIGNIGDCKSKECYLIDRNGNKSSLSGLWRHNNLIEPHAPSYVTYYTDPTVNFNAMINPVVGYPIKGFIWYQGEGNTQFLAQHYAELQSKLIDDWRIRWGQGYLPFIMVQLANYGEVGQKPVESDGMTIVRDAQSKVAKFMPNVGMATAVDIGQWNNIHPMNKREVGRRLYLVADRMCYSGKSHSDAPQFDKFEMDGNKLYVSFTNTYQGLHLSDGEFANSFAIKDVEGNWHWVKGIIDKDRIVIDIKNMKNPIALQYGWSTNPQINLYNSENLPVLPFMVNINIDK